MIIRKYLNKECVIDVSKSIEGDQMEGCNTVNAKIKGTFLGIGDRNIFTAFIYVDHENGSQGFGGRYLKGKYTHDFVAGVLSAVGVDCWEDLKGKPCRVVQSNSDIKKIGHFIEDRWFDPTVWDKE